jgi:hypothetical protein
MNTEGYKPKTIHLDKSEKVLLDIMRKIHEPTYDSHGRQVGTQNKPLYYKYNQGGFCVNCGNAATKQIPTIKIYDWYPTESPMPHFYVCKTCLQQMVEGWK